MAAVTEPPALGLYVTNEQSGDLSIIDVATKEVVGTVKLGKRPRGIVGECHRRRFTGPDGEPGQRRDEHPADGRIARPIEPLDRRRDQLRRLLGDE